MEYSDIQFFLTKDDKLASFETVVTNIARRFDLKLDEKLEEQLNKDDLDSTMWCRCMYCIILRDKDSPAHTFLKENTKAMVQGEEAIGYFLKDLVEDVSGKRETTDADIMIRIGHALNHWHLKEKWRRREEERAKEAKNEQKQAV